MYEPTRSGAIMTPAYGMANKIAVTADRINAIIIKIMNQAMKVPHPISEMSPTTLLIFNPSAKLPVTAILH